jgi:hypothetical protein
VEPQSEEIQTFRESELVVEYLLCDTSNFNLSVLLAEDKSKAGLLKISLCPVIVVFPEKLSILAQAVDAGVTGIPVLFVTLVHVLAVLS